jgi:hypothetical protein
MFASYYDIGDGVNAIDTTADIMMTNIKRDSCDPVIIHHSHNVVRHHRVGKRHDAEALYDWCRDNVRYTRDPQDVEFIQTPKYFLISALSGQLPIVGDCDDFTQIICCLCKSVGLPVGIRIISVNGRRWHHVYGLVRINGYECPMDLTEESFRLGDEHKYMMRKDLWLK